MKRLNRQDAISQVKTVNKAAQGKLTRREFNEALGIFGIASVAVPMMARPALSAGDILYFTWAGFEIPELFPSYVEKYGEPDAAFYGDEYEAIEKLKAGYQADVVCPCIDVMPRWMSADLHPIDESRISLLGETFESLRNADAAFHDGQRYFVPTYWGFSSFVYRTDLTDITPEEESWALLYDERFKGRIGIWDSTDAVIPVASLALGDLEDPYRPSGDRLVKVAEMMRKQRDLVRFYWSGGTDMTQAFVSGEIVISFAWGSTPGQLKKEGVPFKWANPKEGLISFSCGLARANREGDVAAVHDFIDAHLTPEAGKAMIETYNYGHSTQAAFDTVDPALLAELNMSTPEASLAGSHAYDFVPNDLKEEHIRLFDEIKAEAGT